MLLCGCQRDNLEYFYHLCLPIVFPECYNRDTIVNGSNVNGFKFTCIFMIKRLLLLLSSFFEVFIEYPFYCEVCRLLLGPIVHVAVTVLTDIELIHQPFCL